MLKFREINISKDIPKPISSDKDDMPDCISASFVDDLNLINIHEAITYMFAANRGLIPKKIKEISVYKKKLTFTSDPIDRCDFQMKIENLEKFISDYNSGNSWKEYIEKVYPLLIAYMPLASKESKGVITYGKKQKDPQDVIEKRLSIIEDYLEIAKKYINVDVTWNGIPKPSCPACEELFDSLILDEDQGIRICKCGYEYPYISKSSRYKDSSKVNVGTKSDYDESETFMKSLRLYEGSVKVNFPKDFKEKLDAYFIRKDYNIGDYFKTKPHNKKGRKDGTSVKMICEALKDIGLSTYYNCYNIIGHMYWGWNLPNLTEIRPNIIDKYNRLQVVYNEIKTRPSSLNFSILLYIILRSEGINCDWSDFKMLISQTSLEYHQKMLKVMCERTDILYTELF